MVHLTAQFIRTLRNGILLQMRWLAALAPYTDLYDCLPPPQHGHRCPSSRGACSSLSQSTGPNPNHGPFRAPPQRQRRCVPEPRVGRGTRPTLGPHPKPHPTTTWLWPACSDSSHIALNSAHLPFVPFVRFVVQPSAVVRPRRTPTTRNQTHATLVQAVASGPEGRQTIAQRVSAGFRPPMKTQPQRGDRSPSRATANIRSLLQNPTPRNTKRISRKASKPPRCPSSAF